MMQIWMFSRGEEEVTHHPPVGCRKLHEHFIAKNIQRSEGRQTDTYIQMRKDIFSTVYQNIHNYTEYILQILLRRPIYAVFKLFYT